MTQKTLQRQISADLSGMRCDRAVAHLFPEYSRARIQSWIKSGHVLVNSQQVNQRYQVFENDQIDLTVVEEVQVTAEAAQIPLDIIYEDDDILVVNKPAGLVVHPGAGNNQGTLMNALLHHEPALELLPRAGIVHRLDKDTTGLMVVAKNLAAHTDLVRQLQDRTVSREYLALVFGQMTGGGQVEVPIARHPKHRTKMAVSLREDVGKYALTHYRIEKKYINHTLVRCVLETGRTHQIRVHMAHIRHPLVGDKTYAGRSRMPAGVSAELRQHIHDFPRQALHAKRLGVIHPATGDELYWEVDLPEDMQTLLAALDVEDSMP